MTQQRTFHLYKILSVRDWQATQQKRSVSLPAADLAYIHFSTEDQLDKIIAKYWSEVSEYVVLKIDPAKLPGNLVYETNPGGHVKYYHLYDGSIPCDAILESKWIYPKGGCEELCLSIVKIGDPILRKIARPLSEAEILSEEIQELIQEMRLMLKMAPGVGLAAPQIGRGIQLVVIQDMDHTHLTAEQLAERNRYPVPFHVVINPKLFVEDSETVEFVEGCLSVPVLLGAVPRAKSVRVECINEKGEAVVIRAKGWYARILQHEIDHLNGVLFVDRANVHTLVTEENYTTLWKHKKVEEMKCALCR